MILWLGQGLFLMAVEEGVTGRLVFESFEELVSRK